MSKTAYPFLNKLELDQDVIRRLSLLLDSTDKGSDDVFCTPLGSDDRSKIILAELDLVFNSNSHKINDTLRNLEMSNREKFGPRSIAKAWKDRQEDVLSSFKQKELNLDRIKLSASHRSNLRPISISNAMKLLKNNTNSGLPYFTRKSKVKERVLDNFDSLLARRDPCVCFTRTQESSKTRTVWGFPIADTLNEMMYYSPLLSYQKNLFYRAALRGPEEVARYVCDMVISAEQTKESLVSIDIRLFDNSFYVNLQILVFTYFKLLFQDTYRSGLDYIRERFSSIGLITPNKILEGNHGTPSGSVFTNEVGSEGQRILAEDTGYVFKFQVQGDDGVYLVPSDKVDDFIKHFENYGFVINRDKTFVSNEYAVFLQCLYHYDYINKGVIGGIYPVYRALNRLCFQERWSNFEDFDISGRDYYSIRAICILENCKHHPLFEELVRLVLKHDKYSLEYSDQGLSNYIQMITKSEGSEGILINQYGDDIKGINSFEVVKLIKTISP